MFYRRKILLALLAIAGGTLTPQNCQDLLAFFCLRRNKNYYDFFLQEGDSQSLLLIQDKGRLTAQNLLTAQQDFQLQHREENYLALLETKDRCLLQTLAIEIETQGNQFWQRARKEIHTSLSFKPLDSSIEEVSHQPALFTIGYEGLSIDAYLHILLTYHINALIDVRKNPLSRKYGFSKTQLTEATRAANITYIHLPNLGIPSKLRQDLTNEAAYQKLFQYYASQILPEQIETIEQLKTLLHNFERVALTCFEADYHFCHRHKIVEHLIENTNIQVPIFHLNGSCTHSTPNMQPENKKPSYGHKEVNAVYSSL